MLASTLIKNIGTQTPSAIWSVYITGCCPTPLSLSEKNFWPF